MSLVQLKHPATAWVYKSGSIYRCETIDGVILASNTEPAGVIQAGLEYASGKGALLLKNATYTCNALGDADFSAQVLTIYSDTELIGESRDRTKIVLGASMTAKNLLQNSDQTLTGNTNIIVRNMTFDATASVNKATLNMDHVKNSVFQNLYLKNGSGSSFNFFITGGRDGSQVPNFWVDNTLVNNNVLESHASCLQDNFGGGLLRNSIVSNNIAFNSGGSAGFAQRLMSNSVFSHNVSFNNTMSGFNFESCTDNVVQGNIAHDNGDAGFKGLYIATGMPDGFAKRNIFVGNQAYSNLRGIEIDGQGHKIVSNIVRNNEAAGIQLRDADRCTVAFNDIYNNGTDTGLAAGFRVGIRLSYQAQTGYTFVGKTLIFGNNIYDDQGVKTQQTGILETGGTVDSNYIYGNYLEGNVLAPITIAGANSRYWNNVGQSTELYDTTSRSTFSMTGSSTAYSTTGAARYAGIGTLNSNVNATETTVQTTVPYSFRIKRLLVKFSANTMNGNTIIALRDDTATAASVTIAGSTTTEADSGAIDVAVAAGSKINWLIDTTASSSGTHILAACTAFVQVTSY